MDNVSTGTLAHNGFAEFEVTKLMKQAGILMLVNTRFRQTTNDDACLSA